MQRPESGTSPSLHPPSADCVETLEEIQGEIAEAFLHAGGERFTYIPCLNTDQAHIDMMEAIVAQELAGWLA